MSTYFSSLEYSSTVYFHKFLLQVIIHVVHQDNSISLTSLPSLRTDFNKEPIISRLFHLYLLHLIKMGVVLVLKISNFYAFIFYLPEFQIPFTVSSPFTQFLQ